MARFVIFMDVYALQKGSYFFYIKFNQPNNTWLKLIVLSVYLDGSKDFNDLWKETIFVDEKL